MAQEQQELKALGNIIPSMSLNKHINGVPNYSLHEAINMRMSDDRMTIQNIEEIDVNETIHEYLVNYYSGVTAFKILYILACNNELILFVKNNITGNTDKVNLFRYYEKSDTIELIYEGITYYGGKYIADYTYGLNRTLFVSFSEYDGTMDTPLKTLEFTTGKNTIEEYKISATPELILPTITDVIYTQGYSYMGWYTIFIQYKISENNYTNWMNFGYPILVDDTQSILLATQDTINGNYQTNSEIKIEATQNVEIINKTFKMFFTIDNRYNEFRLGFVINNKTLHKEFVTTDIKNTLNLLNYIFNIKILTEENILFDYHNNFYNVKNVINYKNKLYLSNYKVNDLYEYDTSNIKIDLHKYTAGETLSYYQLVDTVVRFNKVNFNLNNSFDRYMIWAANESTSLYKFKKSIFKITGYFDLSPNERINVNDLNNYLKTKVFAVDMVKWDREDFDIIIESERLVVKSNRIYGIDVNGESHYLYTDLHVYTTDGVTEYDTIQSNNISVIGIDDNDNDQILFDITKAESSSYNTIPNIQTISIDYFFEQGLFTIDLLNNRFNYFITGLVPGEIYDFYIHFIDIYGNTTNGFKLQNKYKFYKKENNVIDFNEEYVQIKYKDYLYAIPINIYNTVDTSDFNSYLITNVVFDTNYGYFESNNLTPTQQSALDNFKLKLRDLYQAKDYFKYSVLSTGLIKYNDLNTNDIKFGTYINANNDRLFKVPLINLADDKALGMTISNVTIPSGYVGYFITHKKQEPITLLHGIGLIDDSDNICVIYNNRINIDMSIYPSNFMELTTVRFSDNLVLNVNTYNNIKIPDTYKIPDSLSIGFAGEASTRNVGRTSKLYSEALFKNKSNQNIDIKQTNFTSRDFNYIKLNYLLDTVYTLNNELYRFGNIHYDDSNDFVINTGFNGMVDIQNAIVYAENGIKFEIVQEEQDSEVRAALLRGTAKIIATDQNVIPAMRLFKFFVWSFNNYGTTYLKVQPNVYKDSVYTVPENTLSMFDVMCLTRDEHNPIIYSSVDDLKNKKNIFDNSIVFSDVISDESTENKWRKFNIESYKFISENKGEIVKLFVLGESMFIHCEQAIYLLQFKDYLATTEESLQIQQSNIKDINYKELLPTDKGYAGLQDKDATIIGSFGYIFYENDTHRILRLDNNQLIYMDYPIYQWLQKYKPHEVRFANDVERYNLLIQFKYYINNVEKVLILLYDYLINSFVSVLDSNIYSFTQAFNTKNKLYLLCNKNAQSRIKSFKRYSFNKEIFNVLNKEDNYIQLTNKLSFIYNYNYNAIKYLESIMFKVFKYIKSEDPQTINSIDFTEDPIENIRIPFCGDYIRIYNENVDTGWIDIKEAQNKDTYNNREHYELPYYYLGNWMMNMFRNVKDRKNDINYSKFDKQDYTEADDRARLYGNYFIIEFGFNMNDPKYIGEKSDKFEFQSIEINVSQQFIQQ